MANENLEPCPLCESKSRLFRGYVYCSNNTCDLRFTGCSVEQWNHRPVEDALRKALISVRRYGVVQGNMALIDAALAKAVPHDV